MAFKEFNDLDSNGLNDVSQPKEENEFDLSDSDEIADQLEREKLTEDSEELEQRSVRDADTSQNIEEIPKSLECGSVYVSEENLPPKAEMEVFPESVEQDDLGDCKTSEAKKDGAPVELESIENGYKDWRDYDAKSCEIGKDDALSKEEKVSAIQSVYEQTKDKTDICAPLDSQYVGGFDKHTGKIEYGWPPNLGFEHNTEKSISRDDPPPQTWDRYGYMGGANFSPVPEDGPYPLEKRSAPYIENQQAYHCGTFNVDSYFDKIDAIRSNDAEGLNRILTSETLPTLHEEEFEDLYYDYRASCDSLKIKLDVDTDVTYGLKGRAAYWGDMQGGAEQLTTPLSGEQMMRLGIMFEENVYD